MEQKKKCLLFINFPMFSSLTGVTAQEYFNDPKAMLDAQTETYRRFGTDGPLTPDFGTAAEASAFGGELQYDNKGIPSIHADPQKEAEDFADLEPVDPCSSGWMAKFLEFLDYFAGHVPAGMRISSGNTMAPFTTAAMLRGISELCLDVMDDPEIVSHMLDVITRTEIRYLEEQKKILGSSFDRVFLSDDISSFLSAGQFEAFVAPSYHRIYGHFPEAAHWLHNDGNAAHIAEKIAETPVELWHIGKMIDAGEVFERTGKGITLCGNLDPLQDLLQGTPQSVYDQAMKEMEQYQGTGQHILSTGGFLSYGTPAENVEAMMRAAIDFATKKM